MAGQKTIKIFVNDDGTVEIDQVGWEGKKCHTDVKDLITALGKETKNVKKSEYYRDAKVQIRQKW